MGAFEMHNATKILFGFWVAPQTPIHLRIMGLKRFFWTPRVGVFEIDNATKIVGFWGGAPNTYTSAHHGPEKMLLDTWDGGV